MEAPRKRKRDVGTARHCSSHANRNKMTEAFHAEKIRAGASAAGLRFALVVSRFNSFITERLLAGALDALQAAGANEKSITVVHVPGSFEIPLTAKKLAEARQADAIIAIGCILRGETAHFDYVASEVTRGVQLAQLDTGTPIIFCVLTCDTLEQAIDRAGLKSGNKGYEAGVSAIEMANLTTQLRAESAARNRKTSARGRRR